MKYYVLAAIFLGYFACKNAPDLGYFEGNGDIGPVKQAGSMLYSPVDSSYTISGSGANMWFETDEFHFVWKKMSGNVSLAADIEWIGEGGDPHRKACLIIRQGLEPNSAYADAVVHGDGLTSIQYREIMGGATREVQSNIAKPKRIRIEKEGDYLSMSLALADGKLVSSGGSFKLPFKDPFYIGLGVCSHNAEIIETAKFSNVVLETLVPNPRFAQKSGKHFGNHPHQFL